MIGQRTLASLAQFLGQYPAVDAVLLLAKHAPGNHSSFSDGPALGLQLLNAFRDMRAEAVMALVAELVATRRDLRERLKPHYKFDDRFGDLVQCLRLDGYEVEDRRLTRLDPTLAEAPPIDDDLITALKASGAPNRAAVVQKIEDSATAFRAAQPNYNTALTDARIALETLARDVAGQGVNPGEAIPYDPDKWGSILRHLRERGEFGKREEAGLAGVYAFLSEGAHRPVGVSEVQMTRMGRTLALKMCWFLLKTHEGRAAPGP